MMLLEAFRDEFSDTFLGELVAALDWAYRESWDSLQLEPLNDPEKANLYCWKRRGYVETALRAIAKKNGVKHNTANTGFWNHVVLTTDRFIFTQSRLQDEDEAVRSCSLRRGFAAQQPLLPGFEHIQPALGPAKQYAVVVHGGKYGTGRVDFAHVRFPTADLADYHSEMIDLSFYNELVDNDSFLRAFLSLLAPAKTGQPPAAEDKAGAPTEIIVETYKLQLNAKETGSE